MATAPKTAALKADLKRVIKKLRGIEEAKELTEELLDLQRMIARREEPRPAGEFSEEQPQDAIFTILRRHKGDQPLTQQQVLEMMIAGGFRRKLDVTDIRKLVHTTMGRLAQEKRVVLGEGKKMKTRTITLALTRKES